MKEKGITLLTLAITVTVMLILATITVYSGVGIIESSKLTSFTTEMKIMQTGVNEIYQKYKNGEKITIDGKEYTGNEILNIASAENTENRARKEELFNQLQSDSEAEIFSEDKDKYKFWSKELIKKLGIEGIEQDFFVNIEKRNIISYEGLNCRDKVYYTLGQLPDKLYNVQYQNPNSGKPTFQATNTYTGTDDVAKWKITISNVQYTNGYIKKWQVKYKLNGDTNWRTTEDFEFEVKKAGTCKIQLVNNEITSDEKTLTLVKPEKSSEP